MRAKLWCYTSGLTLLLETSVMLVTNMSWTNVSVGVLEVRSSAYWATRQHHNTETTTHSRYSDTCGLMSRCMLKSYWIIKMFVEITLCVGWLVGCLNGCPKVLLSWVPEATLHIWMCEEDFGPEVWADGVCRARAFTTFLHVGDRRLPSCPELSRAVTVSCCCRPVDIQGRSLCWAELNETSPR